MRSSFRHLFTQGFGIRLTSLRYARLNKMSRVAKLLPSGKEAFLRFNCDKNDLEFTFEYIDQEHKITKLLNFNRKLTETIDAFLRKVDNRITVETQKTLNRRLPKLERVHIQQNMIQKTESQNVTENKIALYNGDKKVEGSITWQDLLQDNADLKLVIFSNIYAIHINIPLITDIELSPIIMVGYPTYPCKFVTDALEKSLSTFTWYRLESVKNSWLRVGKGYKYIPKTTDIGCLLKFICQPKNRHSKGNPVEAVSANPVVEGPICPFHYRHTLTKSRLASTKFRITSYNILADVYTNSQYSRDVLFNYCPPDILSMNYRKQLILNELIGYNSDIICLQEVDKPVFDNDLLPILSEIGYNGRYAIKDKQKEGLAVFYNEKRFYVAATETVVIRDNFMNLKTFSDVWERINNDKLKERFMSKNTTIQVIAFVPKESPNVILLVANAHLYYHPDADHIRLLQGYYTLEYLTYFSRKLKKECPLNRVNIMLCGDFNTTPDSGLYKLITTQHAPKNLPDWRSNSEESVEDIELFHNLSMSSACGTPPYTNYTPNFSGCLDYIFFDTNSFKIHRVIDMPKDEEVKKHGGLPSVTFPSDHIALCVDMAWESQRLSTSKTKTTSV